jgi:hypothetical protein
MPTLDTCDYIEIQNLLHTHPALLDSGDLTALGQLFSQATVIVQGVEEPIISSPSKITSMFEEFLQLYEGVPRTRHIISNLILRADGDDKARASSTVVVFQQTEKLPLQPIITGDYKDRFVREGDVWRFAERRISNDLFGDLSAHGKYEYSPV